MAGPTDAAQGSGTARAGRSRNRVASEFFTGPTHGPLPALLALMTVVTGVVDAVSILALGRVFVANMTGNVVFIGFAIAGAPGFSLIASVIALGAFLAGAGAGGVVVHVTGTHRGRLLAVTTGAETALILAAAVVLAGGADPYGDSRRNLTVLLCALALGLQNAAVRRLAVPDFTTTVLTMTLTGLAADLRHGRPLVAARRLTAVLTMLAGALLGAELVLHHAATAALLLCASVLLVVTLVIAASLRTPAPWQSAAH